MSAPEQWRFQWPDGTWIRWNPDTEAWEKEIPDAAGDEPSARAVDIAPEERWLLGTAEPPAPSVAPEQPRGVEMDAEVTYAESDDWGDDDGDWGDDDADEERGVGLGPRRSAAHVISGRAEEPKSSLRPTIMAGAGIGLAVGIVVTMMLR